MNGLFPVITEYRMMPGSVLYSTSLGGLLVGCPPEVLKTLLAGHLPMPNTVVLPGTLTRGASSQACLEFPFYHFLFIQQGLAQGKKFRVLGSASVLEKLKPMLRVTLTGPNLEEVLSCEQRLGLRSRLSEAKVSAWMKEAEFMALKGAGGKKLEIEDLVEFVPFEIGQTQVVYPQLDAQPEVTIERTGNNQYVCQTQGQRFECDLEQDPKPQEPSYPIKAVPTSPQEKSSKKAFNVRILGNSEGFDPIRPANGLLLRLGGKWLMWDCPAYLRNHLAAVGLEFNDLEGLFISHVHEDHLEVGQSLEPGKRVKIFSSPEIFDSMLYKVMANLDCDYETARGHYEFHPVYADEPFQLLGAEFEVFYSVHAIPALGLKLTLPQSKGAPKRLFISGDHQSRANIRKMVDAGVVSKERELRCREQLEKAGPYDAVLVDVGAGLIHGAPEDYLSCEDPVYYMHTGKALKDLPKGHHATEAGMRVLLVPE
ncbi:MAG: hypothetical protein RRB13_09335 [bacterium]|nr:hypothetical protein [bacterium]